MADVIGAKDELWKPRRVLSIDGGGIRGLSAIMIIKAVMEKVNDERTKRNLPTQEPWEYFDMMGGTSTGGIIAVMLGRLRMSLEQCEKAYRILSSDIFAPRRSSWNIFGRGRDFLASDGRFDAKALEHAIKSVIEDQLPGGETGQPSNGNKDEQNADQIDYMEINPVCQVFVTTAFRDTSTPIILRTYTNDKKYDAISRDMKIWEACRATSAASTFFEPFKHAKQDLPFVDGAVRWNNPITQAWIEARDIWPEDQNRTIFLSIGTGYEPHISLEGNIPSLLRGIVKLATDTENEAQEFYDLHRDDLVDGKRYFRLNVPGICDVGLDEHAKFSHIRQKTYHYLGENAGARLKDCCNALEVQVILSASEESLLTDYDDTRAVAAVDSQRQWDDTADCAKGTLEWFPENTTYQSWKGSSASMVLLITAEAGCGKTVLAKHLSLHLGPIEQPRVPCCYFFFHSRNENSTVANTLFTLLWYLLRSPLVHPEYSKFVLGKHHSPVSLIKRGERFLYDLICKAAPHMHCGASPFPCILDGLDECKDPERLMKLLHDNNTEFPFKLAITTREIIDSPRWKSSSIINLNDYQDYITDDIRTVIKKNVEELDIDTGEDKKASLERDAVAQSGETFLWQASFFEEIRLMSTSSISKIRDLLKDTPSSVRDCYERILERRPHPKTTRKILNILVASARPLTLDEFDVSLGVTIDEPSWEATWKDISHRLEGSSNIETFLKHHCGSLLKIRNGTVVIFHQTVKDFLLSGKMEITLEGANRCLAIGCINYLLLEDWNTCRIKFKRRSFAFSEGREGVPRFFDLPLLTTDPSYSMTCLYEYSARHWFQHVEDATVAQDLWKGFMDSNETYQCDLLIQGVKTLCSRSRGRLATSIPAFPDTDTPLLFSLRIRCLPLIFGILCQLENSHTLLKEQFGSQPLLLAAEQDIPAAFQFMLNHSDKKEHYNLLSDALRHAIKLQNPSMSEFIVNLSQKSSIGKKKHRALYALALACAIDRDMLHMVKLIIDLAQKSGFSDLLNHDLTQRSLDPAVRGQSSVFDFLIDHGFTFGDNSLSRAISKDRICSDRCVGALLQSGVIPTIEHLHQAVNFGRTAVLDSLVSHYISGHSISDQNLALFLSDEISNNDPRCWPLFQVLLENAMFFYFSNSEHHPLKTLLFETLPQIVQSRPTLRNVLIMLALGIRDEDGKMLQATQNYRLGDETIRQIERASAARGNISEITWRKIIGAALLNANEVRALHRAGASPSSSDTRSIALSNFFDDRWVPATDRYSSAVHALSRAVSGLSVDCIKSTAFLFDMPETVAAPTLLLFMNRYSIETVIEFLRARGKAIHFFRKTMTVHEAVDATSLGFVVRSFQGFLAQLSAKSFESMARHLICKAPKLAFAHEEYIATSIEHVLPCACKHNRPLALDIISYAENENNQTVLQQVPAETLHYSIQAGDLDLCKALLQSGGDKIANSTYSDRTPLMVALLNHQSVNWPLDRSRRFSRKKNDEIIKLLLSYSADPWLDVGKGADSWLCIGSADPRCAIDSWRHMGSKENIFNTTSSTFSIAAESYGLKYFIELWKEVPFALPVNAKGQEQNSRKSMLHRAVYNYEDLETVEYLLDNMQMDPNQRDGRNRSVLHDLVASLSRRVISKSSLKKSAKPLIKLLVARGAEINGFDYSGYTPIQLLPILCQNNFIDHILKILISSGADYGWLKDESKPTFDLSPFRDNSLFRYAILERHNLLIIKGFLQTRRCSGQKQASLTQQGSHERSADEWQQEIIGNFGNFISGLDRDLDILSHPGEEELASSHDENELPDWDSECTSGENESITDAQMDSEEGSQTDASIQEHVYWGLGRWWV